MENNLSCYLCETVVGLDFKSFFYHLKIFHNITDNSNEFKCGYSNCNKVTQTKKGIREHMTNCSFRNVEVVHEEISSVSNNHCGNSLIELTSEFSTQNVQLLTHSNPKQDFESQFKHDFVNQMKTNIVNLIGTLNCKMLPNTTIDLIISNIKTLLNSIFLYIRSNFLISNKDFIDTYLEFVTFQNIILNEIDSLSSAYKRRKLALENVPEPRDVVLGMRFDRQFDKKMGVFIEKPISDSMVYISLKSSLKYLLENRAIQNYISQENNTVVEGIYKNISDGSFIKSKEFYSMGEKRLLIQIYIDDFEPVNGMGYKTGIHKTTPVYFILRNLPHHLQSKLKNINLLALINAQDTKFYGYNNVLFCIVQDLKFLEDTGLEVQFLSNQKTLKGGLAAICGDNLGTNGVVGMTECFSTGNFCRLCLIDYDLISTVVEESQVELRTKTDYQKDVDLSEATNKIINGVKSYCILHQLKHFHFLDAPTVDIMHDILEGVGQWDLKEFVDFVTANKLLTQQQINDKIASFNFGPLESTSLPNSISYTRKGLGLKAAQAWCLIRHAPLIFKSLFENTENEELVKRCKLVRLINSIMLIVFSPTITEGMIVNLSKFIKQHHLLLLSIRNYLRPKDHFLIHYPRVIRIMGPLIGLWCMRFEAKHLSFKKQAQSCQNFVNICKSFAFRHQEAVYFNDVNDSELTFQKLKIPFNDCDKFKELLEPSFPQGELLFVKSITHIQTFQMGFFICTGIDKITNNPIFNEITAIFIFKKLAYFVLSSWKTNKFDEKLNAFQISKHEKETLTVGKSHEIYHFAPFYKLIIDNNYFIVPQHSIV